MPECKETAPPPSLRLDRSVAARKAARLRKASRESRIVSLLNRGVSVAEIAAREGLSTNRFGRGNGRPGANRSPALP
jgi:DNA-binding NarL/FixJ family response regulator